MMDLFFGFWYTVLHTHEYDGFIWIETHVFNYLSTTSVPMTTP